MVSLSLAIGNAVIKVLNTVVAKTQSAVSSSVSALRTILVPNANFRSYLTDSKGRIVLYHGINVSNYSKTSVNKMPWQTLADYTKLQRWGFNLVRMLVFWESIEPTQGHYNSTYINNLKQHLTYLKNLGIDVVLDFHQDLFNRKFGGNGFPDWATNDSGIPFTPVTPWNLNYLQPAVIAAYRNFYNNATWKTAYVNMISWTLGQLMPTYPNIIGIDIMNEPFPAQLTNFEQTTLTNFYKQVHAMIKQRGYNVKLFSEPQMYTSAGLPSALAFNPGNNLGMYAPHYYDAIVHEGGNYTAIQKEAMQIAVDLKVGEGKTLGSPVIFGEWGCGASPNYLNYMQDFLDLMDQYVISWCYWCYDKSNVSSFGILNSNGTERPHLTKLVRPYPQRVMGKNLKIVNGARSIQINYNTSYDSSPTIVFIPLTLPKTTIKINGNLLPQPTRIEYLSYQNDKRYPTQQIYISW